MTVLIFGGTTEGREAARGVFPCPVIYSAVSEYASSLMDVPTVTVRTGPMDRHEMEEFMRQHRVKCAIDATHPYAREATDNIHAACTNCGVPYIRVSRGASSLPDGVLWAENCAQAARMAESMEGRVLLTVGSKELKEFTSLVGRLYARVLPTSEVLLKCEAMGLDPAHIIAMQGPFSHEANEAMIKSTGARILITKDSGKSGGFAEKISAATAAGVQVLVVTPPNESGVSVLEAIKLAGEAVRCGASPGYPRFPMMTDLGGKLATVVGYGDVGRRRAHTLAACGACVRIISPALSGELPAHAEHLARHYEDGDLDGCAIAVAATDSREVNRAVGCYATRAGIPVSVADAPDECSFFFPSLVTCGSVAAAVSTSGESPALCRKLSDRLRAVWPKWVEEARREV